MTTAQSARRVALVLLIAALAVPWAAAQITSENSDRHTIINARGVGLADALVSDARDVSVMYWNPGGLSFLEYRTINLSYSLERTPSSQNLMTENVTLPLPSVGSWSFGIGLTAHHVSSSATSSNSSALNFLQGTLDFGISYAFTPSFAVGVDLTGRYGKIGSGSKNAGSASLGLFYDPYPGITYGLAYEGFGSGINYPYEDFTSATVLHTSNLARSLQLGLTLKFPAETGTSVVAVTLANQKIFGESGLVYKGGLEVVPVRYISLRVGYWVGPSSVATKLGAGLNFDRFRLDYGVSPNQAEPQTHQVTLAIAL